MSLVADLLSKVKPTGRKGDVPPNLKKVVSDLSDKKATKKKIIIYSVLLLVSIVGGVGTVFFIDIYLKPETGSKTSTISTEELKKRVLERQASQVTKEKQENTEAKKDSGQKTDDVSKPLPVIEKEKPPQSKELPVPAETGPKETVTEPPKETVTEPPKEIEKQKEDKQEPDVKPEEIKKPEEPEENHEVATRAPEPRDEEPPPNKDVYIYLAKSYEVKGEYSKAFDSYKIALEADPGDYHVMNNISSVLLHLGVFEESIEYSEMALNVKKDYVPSLVNLGIAYIKNGNLSAGEGYLLKVLSLQPTNRFALFNLALLYEKIGEYDKAYGSYQRLTQMKDSEGYLGLARISEKQNRISEAITFYRQIISMDDVDPRVKKMATDRIDMLQ